MMTTRNLDGSARGRGRNPPVGRFPGLPASHEAMTRIQQIVTRLRLVTAPSRQSILLLLAEGEKNVGDICEALGNPSQPAVSHQLSLLRHGRLIESQRRGRHVFYVLTDSGRALARAFHVLGKVDMSPDRAGRRRRGSGSLAATDG